jgi:molybdopterin synthase catalytic subunit
VTPRFALVSVPIDARGVIDAAMRDPGTGALEPGRDGAVVTFAGLVRLHNLGRRVVRLEYEAYVPLAVTSFERIAREAAAEWPGMRLALHHRVGALEPGEPSIFIAACSPHRGEAFAACRYAIERVKQISPIWKREIFDEGEAWVEGATAHPDEEGPRAEARRRACA